LNITDRRNEDPTKESERLFAGDADPPHCAQRPAQRASLGAGIAGHLA
jgi:hypothetical protein